MPKAGQMRRTDRRLTAVGAYIFAGGFTMGVKRHLEVLAHLEDGSFGVATARANWPNLPIYVDSATWPTESLRRKNVGLVYCNPPCAPWSNSVPLRSGNTFDWRTHPKAECVTKAFSLLESVRPMVWCFESVRQVWTKAKDMLDSMTMEAASLGYSTTHVFTAGPEHGVPQHRKRYFMVCHKIQIDFDPPPERSDPTVLEALAQTDYRDDVECKPQQALIPVIPHMLPGESARKAYNRMKLQQLVQSGDKQPAFLYDRLHDHQPSYTILGSCCTKVHPIENRLITLNEAKALCGFPASFKLVGTVNARFAQLGRGVMPSVADWLAKQVATALRNDVIIVKPSVKAIDVCRGRIVEMFNHEIDSRGVRGRNFENGGLLAIRRGTPRRVDSSSKR